MLDFLYFMLGIVIMFIVPELFYLWKDVRSHNNLRKLLVPQKLNPNKICKGSHTWIITPVVDTTGNKMAHLCRICGFISGTDKVASQEAIDKIEEYQKVQALEEGLYKQFLHMEDQTIKDFFANEISNGLNFDKLVQVHNAGITFGERFATFKILKSKEIQPEVKKIFEGNG